MVSCFNADFYESYCDVFRVDFAFNIPVIIVNLKLIGGYDF